MFPRIQFALLISAFALAAAAAPAPPVPVDADLQKAIDEYTQGHTSNAVSLLLQQLKNKPDSPAAHYYLGMALKKSGADATAIAELETAIKLCPPGALQMMAMEAYHDKFKEDEVPTKPPENTSWWSGIANFFNPPKPVKTITDSILPSHDAAGKAALLAIAAPKPSRVITVSLGGNEGDVIHMGEMLRLAQESQKLDPSLQSHASGVSRFPQAPENNSDWDLWIKRFRRTFDSMVFRHVIKEAGPEKSGTASIIFSLDKDGHLRGCVYNATANDTLINCLLESVRELDRSYILAFPPDSYISGWNFRMRWNFGHALDVVKNIRQIKIDAVARARKRYQDQLNAQLLEKKRLEELAAKEKKLAKIKLAAKAAPPQMVVKTGVAGLVLPKPKPLELKAQQLKLSDMPPMNTNLSDQEIDDLSIRAGDVSRLFR